MRRDAPAGRPSAAVSRIEPVDGRRPSASQKVASAWTRRWAAFGQHDRQARMGVVGHRPADELEHDDALAAADDPRAAR